MSRPVELSLRKIIVRKKYFPRFKIKKSRVQQFRQAMRDGEHIPPIIVANDKDKYVVIEGVHRVTAAKLERQNRILADFWQEKDESMWLADAARMNDKTREPLTTAEMEEVVRRLWRLGIRDTAQIARRIGRNIRFVQRVLKPLREKSRQVRDEEIIRLAEQGFSQEEIARRTKITQERVCQIINKRHVSFIYNINHSSKLNNDISLHNAKDDSVIETSQIDESAEEVTRLAEQGLPQKEIATKVGLTRQPGSDCPADEAKHPSEKPDCELDPRRLDMQSNPGTPQSDPPSDDNTTQEARPSPPIPNTNEQHLAIFKRFKLNDRYPSQVPYYDIDYASGCEINIKPDEYLVARILELIATYDQDFDTIQEDIGERMDWIRKIAVLGIGLAIATFLKKHVLSDQQLITKATFAFQVDLKVVHRTSGYWLHFPRLQPIKEGMDQWVNANLRPEEIEKIAEFLDIPVQHLPYLVTGENPPASQPEFLPKEDFKAISRALDKAKEIVEIVTDTVHTKPLADEQIKQLLASHNLLTIKSNELHDELIKRINKGFLGVTRQ